MDRKAANDLKPYVRKLTKIFFFLLSTEFLVYCFFRAAATAYFGLTFFVKQLFTCNHNRDHRQSISANFAASELSSNDCCF